MIPDKAFYALPENIQGNHFILDQDESKHIINVLRLKMKQGIFLLDGLGNGYQSVITDLTKFKVSGEIEKKYVNYGENKSVIKLVPAIIKRDRFEILIEKAIELGVKEIQPLILDRCVKKSLNLDRCKKIIISSAKQCRRSFFPVIKEPINLETYLKKRNECSIVGSQKSNIKLSKLDIKDRKSIQIIIGPEGDFSKREYDLMQDHDIQFFNLGQRRLRSETANLATLSILNEFME